MNLSDKVRIPPEVIARQVGDETVMLDLARGAYFGLDPVGARIWQLLEAGRSLLEICDTIVDEYEVSREAFEQDLLRLVDSLAKSGLLVPA
ncbi:MAG: PqqD family protein [Burkholderiales bacterium]